MAQPSKQWILDRLLAPVTFGTGPIERVRRFFALEVWRVHPAELGLAQQAFYRTCRVLYLTWRGFIGDKVRSRASALTYITALSLVPLLALGFSVLKGLGFYQTLLDKDINPFLDRLLGPLQAPDAAGDLASGIDPGVVSGAGLREALNEVLTLVSSTDVKGLGAVGLVVVLWAVMRLLGSVESAFNDIWGLHRSRSILRKLSDYLTIVTVAPVFLVLAIAFRASIESTFDAPANLAGLLEFSLRAALPLGACATFTCVYLVLPNTRARFSSALLGGSVAGVLWLLAVLFYVKFQVGVARYNAIYAGFAALPVFLVWVQLSWVIVLLGAEVAFAHEYEPAYRGLASYQGLGHGALERVALGSMTRITEDFLSGADPRSSSTLAAELGLAPQPVEELLGRLADAKLLVPVAEGEGTGGGYVLARDPGSITIKSVLDALKASQTDPELRAGSAADEELTRLLAKLDAEAEGSAYNLTLRDVVQRTERTRLAGDPAGVERTDAQPS